MATLNDVVYLKFPFSIGEGGPRTSGRADHIREQIEQVLFTSPRERVFRPEFGVGVRRLVFEPNNMQLRNTTLKQLNASLSEALYGEVDPKTLDVEVASEGEKLLIRISYVLAAINKHESQSFELSIAGGAGG